MKLHKWDDIKNKGLTAERIAQRETSAAAKLLEMDLRGLRELAGRTQVEVAVEAEVVQSAIARLEKGDGDPKITTIRRYVEALGGTLEVVAVLGNHRVALSGL